MKITKLLTLVLILMVTSISQATLDEGLVAYYPFNGDANDSSGNGNHGIVYGATLTNDRFGYIDSAYSFDGIDDYIDIGNDSVFDIHNEISISVWVKKTISFENGMVISKWKTESGWQGSWFMYVDTGGYVHFAVSGDGWNGNEAISDTPITLHSFYHLVGLYNIYDNTIRVFINGIETGTAAGQAGSIFVSNAKIYIGAAIYCITSGCKESYFEGIIDDLRIYNRALTDEEIQLLYTNITVLSPNGNEEFIAGQVETIRWDAVGDINFISLDYSDNNGVDWNVIDANTQNDSSYDWILPQVTSNQCLVRVSDANDANTFDISDDLFTIYVCQNPQPGDLNEDCYIDFIDFSIMAQNWLWCGNPFDPDCL